MCNKAMRQNEGWAVAGPKISSSWQVATDVDALSVKLKS